MNQPLSHSRYRLYSWLAWILCGLISLSALIGLWIILTGQSETDNAFQLAGEVTFVLMPVVFAVLGALILSRQPRNVIGWLVMIPAISFSLPIEYFTNRLPTAPPNPSATLLLALWINSWDWILLIFPIFFIPVLFPTGRPPSPRWRWLIIFGLAMCATLIFLATFSQKLGPQSEAWSVPNPIGFIPEDFFDKYLVVPWGIGLLSLTVLCTASLFVRYRRATAVEREQIKWLLYACALFAAVYILTFWTNESDTTLNVISGNLLNLAILALPMAIAIAILRYRLWDIDVIIRRTLVYGALTLTLALVYFGGVVLLQALFQAITGQSQSPVATVISTLIIAALFTPLRRRIQNDIDRRFYRQKYDAMQILAAFTQTARDETRLEALVPALLGAVQDSLQPEQVWLWLKER